MHPSVCFQPRSTLIPCSHARHPCTWRGRVACFFDFPQHPWFNCLAAARCFREPWYLTFTACIWVVMSASRCPSGHPTRNIFFVVVCFVAHVNLLQESSHVARLLVIATTAEINVAFCMKLPNPVHVASDTLLASDQVLRNSHMSRSCEDSLPLCGFLFHNKRQFSGLVACFLPLPFLPLLLPFWALPLFLFCCLSLQHAAATCPRSQLLSLYKQSLR